MPVIKALIAPDRLSAILPEVVWAQTLKTCNFLHWTLGWALNSFLIITILIITIDTQFSE
jgi:hypothetical protein